MEATIGKAKDTYKKYDSYLENAEDAVYFAWSFALVSVDLIDQTFENLIRESQFDFQNHFKKQNSEEIEFKRKNSIEKIAKSEFLKKKKLFTDIGKIVNLKEDLQMKDAQAKFDKIQSLLLQSTHSKLAHVNLKLSHPEELVSINSGSNQVSELKEPASKSYLKERDSFLQQNLCILSQNMVNTKSLLEGNPNVNLEPEVLADLITKTNEFIGSIQSYLFNLKNWGSSIDEDFENLPETVETHLFSLENLERAIAKVRVIEQAELVKLMELKNKNDDLRGVQAHVA